MGLFSTNWANLSGGIKSNNLFAMGTGAKNAQSSNALSGALSSGKTLESGVHKAGFNYTATDGMMDSLEAVRNRNIQDSFSTFA